MFLKNILVVVLLVLIIFAFVKLSNVQVPSTYRLPEQVQPVFYEAPSQVSPQNVSVPIAGIARPENQISTVIADFVNLDQISDYVESRCGDSVCDASENCESCTDCACGGDERCSLGSICVQRELCRDDICTELERNTRSCCSDCNCSASTFCNENSQTCLARVQLTPLKINQSIEHVLSLPQFNRYTFYNVYDDYYENKVVKVIVLRCPGNTNFFCEGYVYLNATGAIIAMDHTT